MVVNDSDNYKMGIYEIRNLVNGKRYVGSSKDIPHRFNVHKSQLRNGNHHSVKLQRAWDKYGEGAFTFSYLEQVGSEDHLVLIEQVWLDWFDCVHSGYNILPLAGRPVGYKHTDESRAKISAGLMGNTNTKGRPISDEHKEAISRGSRRLPNRAGIPHTEEVKRQISESLKGNTHTLGHKLSDEHKAKISAAHKGRVSNRKGCVMSKEQKKKISDSLRKRRENKALELVQEECLENHTSASDS